MEQIIKTTTAADYRDGYTNSVQVRYSLWDFFLTFGMVKQVGEQLVIENYQGVYLSPQHTKALVGILQERLDRYEAAFGAIHVELTRVEALSRLVN